MSIVIIMALYIVELIKSSSKNKNPCRCDPPGSAL